jgi:hypothetical protein
MHLFPTEYNLQTEAQKSLHTRRQNIASNFKWLLCHSVYILKFFCNSCLEEDENGMYEIPVPLRGDSDESSPFSPPHWNRLPLHPEQSNLSEGLLWHAPSCDWVFLAGTRLVFSDPAPTSKVKRIKTDEGSRICYEVHVMPRLLIFWIVILLIFQSYSTVLRISSELTNVRSNTIREIKYRMRWGGM